MKESDRIIRFLTEGLHCNEIPSKSKYRQFKKNNTNGFYFVGKNGALRAGKNISNSISLTDHIEANMKLWEAKNANS